MKTLYLTPLALALLAGCSATPKAFEIDNPTAAAMAVELDGHVQQIPAHSSLPVSLQPGAHTLRSPALGEINFVVSRSDQGGLINPTRSEYVIARGLDAAHAPALSRFNDQTDAVTVNGTLYQGPYRSSRDLVIARSWRAGVHEAPPVGTSSANPALTDAKIFAATDFESFYRDSVEGPSTYAYVVNPVMPAPNYLDGLHSQQLPNLSALAPTHVSELGNVYTAYVSNIDPLQAVQNEDGTRMVYLQPNPAQPRL